MSTRCDLKPRHEGPRDDLYAAMTPLDATKALFAHVAGTLRARRTEEDWKKNKYPDKRSKRSLDVWSHNRAKQRQVQRTQEQAFENVQLIVEWNCRVYLK